MKRIISILLTASFLLTSFCCPTSSNNAVSVLATGSLIETRQSTVSVNPISKPSLDALRKKIGSVTNENFTEKASGFLRSELEKKNPNIDMDAFLYVLNEQNLEPVGIVLGVIRPVNFEYPAAFDSAKKLYHMLNTGGNFGDFIKIAICTLKENPAQNQNLKIDKILITFIAYAIAYAQIVPNAKSARCYIETIGDTNTTYDTIYRFTSNPSYETFSDFKTVLLICEKMEILDMPQKLVDRIVSKFSSLNQTCQNEIIEIFKRNIPSEDRPSWPGLLREIYNNIMDYWERDPELNNPNSFQSAPEIDEAGITSLENSIRQGYWSDFKVAVVKSLQKEFTKKIPNFSVVKFIESMRENELDPTGVLLDTIKYICIRDRSYKRVKRMMYKLYKILQPEVDLSVFLACLRITDSNFDAAAITYVAGLIASSDFFKYLTSGIAQPSVINNYLGFCGKGDTGAIEKFISSAKSNELQKYFEDFKDILIMARFVSGFWNDFLMQRNIIDIVMLEFFKLNRQQKIKITSYLKSEIERGANEKWAIIKDVYFRMFFYVKYRDHFSPKIHFDSLFTKLCKVNEEFFPVEIKIFLYFTYLLRPERYQTIASVMFFDLKKAGIDIPDFVRSVEEADKSREFEPIVYSTLREISLQDSVRKKDGYVSSCRKENFRSRVSLWISMAISFILLCFSCFRTGGNNDVLDSVNRMEQNRKIKLETYERDQYLASRTYLAQLQKRKTELLKKIEELEVNTIKLQVVLARGRSSDGEISASKISQIKSKLQSQQIALARYRGELKGVEDSLKYIFNEISRQAKIDCAA